MCAPPPSELSLSATTRRRKPTAVFLRDLRRQLPYGFIVISQETRLKIPLGYSK